MITLNEHQQAMAGRAWQIAVEMNHPDPAGFLAKIWAESRFNPMAYNKASGAAGIAQVMPATAPSL